MGKYENIITNLSIKDKYNLLTNLSALSDGIISLNYVPKFQVKNIKDLQLNNEPLLSLEDIASSWNEELIEKYAYELAKYYQKDNLKILLGLNASILETSNEERRISEDPILTGKLAASYIRGMDAAGVAVALEGFNVNQNSKYISKEYNELSAINNYLKPYEIIIKEANPKLVFESYKQLMNSYDKFNEDRVLDIFVNKYGFKNLVLSDCIKSNKFNSNNYISYKPSEGLYMSEEALYNISNIIDERLEKLLDIICGNSKTNDSDLNLDIIYKAYLDSIVLLKNNNNVLPLRTKHNVYVIGQSINFDNDKINSYTSEYVNCESIKCFDMISFAKSGLKPAENDVVILLMDNTIGQNNILFRNQVSLLDKLSNNASLVIPVLKNNAIVDLSFDEKCNVLFKAPVKNNLALKALLDIIFGLKNPCGKLCFSYPNNVNQVNLEKENVINNQLTDITNYYGYKYFEKTNLNVKYPFGYGLSYSNFQYHNLALAPTNVSFTIKNDSGFNACETLQVYVASNVDGKETYPKKLYTFKQVQLEAGESQDIDILIEENTFNSYNANFKYEQNDNAVNEVFICTGAQHVALRGKMIFNEGVKDEIKTQEKFVEETNIIKEDFVLKEDIVIEKEKPVKEFVRKYNKKTRVSIIILALLFEVLAISIIASVILEMDLILYVAAFISLIAFLVLIIISLKKVANEEKKELFKDISLNDLFKEEAEEINDEIQINYDEDDKEIVIAPVEELEDFTVSKLENIYEKLSEYLLKSGLFIKPENLKVFLAALSAEKIILLKKKDELTNKFISIISQFFGAYYNGADYVDETYESETNLFFKGKAETKFKHAIDVAIDKENVISFAALENVEVENLDKYFNTIINAAKYRNKIAYIRIDEERIKLPKHLWYFLILNDKTNLALSSNELLQNSIYVDLDLKAVEESDDSKEVENINFRQFEKLIEDMKEKLNISEENYKKIDALEDYVSEICTFSFTNKINLAIERFAAIYLALENNEESCLDHIVSSRLLPMVLTALYGKELEEEMQIDIKLDNIFGEDNTIQCHKTLKALRTNEREGE